VIVEDCQCLDEDHSPLSSGDPGVAAHLPADIKSTYDKLGIPEAERQRLIAGVAAQYESEVVYHKIREELQDKGVIFLDTDTALKEHPDLLREYFATIIRWATTSPPR